MKRRLIVALVVLTSLLMSVTPALAWPRAPLPREAPLDLAAIVLWPRDLPGDDLTFWGGHFTDAGGAVTFRANLRWTFAADGFTNGYRSPLASADRDTNRVDVSVESAAIQFATVEGAGRAYAALVRVVERRSAQGALTVAPGIGTRSLEWSELRTSSDGSRYPTTSRYMLRDTLLLGVTVGKRGTSATEPPAIAQASDALIARAERVQRGRAPDLSQRTLDLTGQLTVLNEAYSVIDGIRHSPEDVVIDRYAVGAVDAFTRFGLLVDSDVLAGPTAWSQHPGYILNVARYRTASEAAAAVRRLPDSLTWDPSEKDLTVSPQAVSLSGAAGAVTIQYEYAAPDVHRFTLWVAFRVGNLVSVMAFAGTRAISFERVRALAELQVDALRTGIAPAVPVPDGLARALTKR